MKHFILLLSIFLSAATANAQLVVKGTVFDVTRSTPVEQVQVSSVDGKHNTYTDTLGRYTIELSVKDSVLFTYRNKSTLRYAVKDIPDIQRFDIALHITVASKYKALKEVIVISKTYQQDSLENRETYAPEFGYKKPGIQSSMVNGAVGMDANELINIFRFRRNKYLKKFQARLLQQEQDKYIDYRFNRKIVKNITKLDSAALDSCMTIFRPNYEFTRVMPLYEFYQYIQWAGQQYKAGVRKNVFFRGWRREEE